MLALPSPNAIEPDELPNPTSPLGLNVPGANVTSARAGPTAQPKASAARAMSSRRQPLDIRMLLRASSAASRYLETQEKRVALLMA